jgi:hypothetical protein
MEETFASLGLPPIEAVYTEPDAIKAALQKHAADNGYSVAVESS